MVANRNSATLTIMLGDGKSGFITMPLGIGANPRAVKTGDFNRDGKIDLAAPHNNAGFVSILLGNGDGSFAPPANVNIGRLPFAIVIGDFNSDGKQDFAASVYFSQEATEDRVLIFAGDGAGRFGFAGEFVTPNASYLAASDFNADGLTDLAAMSGVSVWAAINECNAASAIALTNVSAASYRRLNLASESIVAAFGAGLSAGTASAPTLPLPTQLGGSSVKVKTARASNARRRSFSFRRIRSITRCLRAWPPEPRRSQSRAAPAPRSAEQPNRNGRARIVFSQRKRARRGGGRGVASQTERRKDV